MVTCLTSRRETVLKAERERAGDYSLPAELHALLKVSGTRTRDVDYGEGDLLDGAAAATAGGQDGDHQQETPPGYLGK